MQRTYEIGREARVVIEHLHGDIEVRSWDSPSIGIDADGSLAEPRVEGNALFIGHGNCDLELRVPPDTEVIINHVSGDISIAHVRRAELNYVSGDIEVEDIGLGVNRETIGEAVALRNVSAELTVKNASSLRSRDGIGGDASISNVPLVEIESVGADLELSSTETAVIGTVGSDLEAKDIADALSCGSVGSDCQISGGPQAEITLGNVGADLQVQHALRLHVGSAGSDCVLQDIRGSVEVGSIGSDARFIGIGGDVHAGSIGSDTELKDVAGAIEIGNVGGDLSLQSAFPAGSHTRLLIGGDASIQLPENANLRIEAIVGGDVMGPGVSSSRGGNMLSLVYGEGAATLEVRVGGDLRLRGHGSPRSSTTSNEWWSEFESEMAELGREMGRMGQELGREISGAFKDAAWSKGTDWTDEFTRRAEEQVRRAQRRAEEQARRAEERARRAEERAARVRVRFNDREWQFDPQRLERLKEEARKAAAEGVAGALEAVERAISNLRVPTPPRPPVSPTPPPAPAAPPVPGTPTPPPDPASPSSVKPVDKVEPVEPVEQMDEPANSGTDDASVAQDAAAGREQEREAILRMIAEGRISPEEGDLLLEGLGGE